jgi:hypothetical protein
MTKVFRNSVRAGLAVVAAAALFCTPPTGRAQLPTFGDVVKVEQDWELVVGEPDTTLFSPQLFILMYPQSGGDYWSEFLINYNDQPQFSAGGVQIQVWEGNNVLDGADNSPHQAVLQNAGESVTFTLSMRVRDGNLRLHAKNVSSPSFGYIPNLSVSVPYDPTNLNNYSTTDTMSNSGILFGSNRVTSLTLKAVRKYDAAGNVQTEPGQQLFPQVPNDVGGGIGNGGGIGGVGP